LKRGRRKNMEGEEEKEAPGSFSVLSYCPAQGKSRCAPPFSLVSCCLASLSFLSKSPTKD